MIADQPHRVIMGTEWTHLPKECDIVSAGVKGSTCHEGVLGRQRDGKEACGGCRRGAEIASGSYCGGLAGKLGPGLHPVYSQARNKRSEPGTKTRFKRQSPGTAAHSLPQPESHTDPDTSPLPCRCWVQSPVVHWALVIGYGGLTSLFNLVVLAWALRVLRRLKAQEKAPGPRACRDTVTVLGLTMLLGTTWTLAFFSFGIFLLPQLFLFTIFNSLYGESCAWPGGSPGWGGPGTPGRCLLLKGSG